MSLLDPKLFTKRWTDTRFGNNCTLITSNVCMCYIPPSPPNTAAMPVCVPAPPYPPLQGLNRLNPCLSTGKHVQVLACKNWSIGKILDRPRVTSSFATLEMTKDSGLPLSIAAGNPDSRCVKLSATEYSVQMWLTMHLQKNVMNFCC